jgi:hypothetical protein
VYICFRTCVRTCALNHSHEFLTRHESKLAEWVKSAANANRAEAIHALLSQSHTDDVQDPWHPVALARQAAQVLGPEVGARERAREQTHIEQSSSAALLTLRVFSYCVFVYAPIHTCVYLCMRLQAVCICVCDP